MLDRIGAITAMDTTTGQQAHEKERIQGELDSLKAPLLSVCDQAVTPPVGPSAGRPLHWQIEYPERFLDASGTPLAEGGFDAVIGNPPYVRIQALGRDVAEYCRARYETATGAFDAFVPFIERGVSLLRPRGRLGFIVPSAFLKLEYGARLRARLAERSLIEEIIDFGHAQVFEGATNYTCIVVLEREGDDDLSYVAVRGSSDEVRRAVSTHALPAAERYRAGELGEAPWMLVPRDEREILDAMRAAGRPLSDATRQIFQGLITSADPIYIVEDRGTRGSYRVVATKAGAELELEPDLLHPLASGLDVERYALRTLNSLLLFPYRREKGEMRLVGEEELQALPLTWEYLCASEVELRRRERGKMDHDGWWAFGRRQSLGLHDQPKLGVAATVKRLEVAADPAGAAYFHNVRVNGILPRDDGPSLPVLTAVLNSRAIDFAFRRGAAPLQNDFYTANKQFIAWLPVPTQLPRRSRGVGRASARARRSGRVRAEWVPRLAVLDHRGSPARSRRCRNPGQLSTDRTRRGARRPRQECQSAHDRSATACRTRAYRPGADRERWEDRRSRRRACPARTGCRCRRLRRIRTISRTAGSHRKRVPVARTRTPTPVVLACSARRSPTRLSDDRLLALAVSLTLKAAACAAGTHNAKPVQTICSTQLALCEYRIEIRWPVLGARGQ